MKFGLDENEKFYVEYTACSRPVGNVRQEMEIACKNLAEQGKVLISLSGGLDSQVVLHSFNMQKLPVECAFLYHPGYNEVEYEQVKILEQKYNFKSIVVTMDPNLYRSRVEAMSLESKIPPEHFIMQLFLKQLPDDAIFLEGIDSPDLLFSKDNKCYCLESWNSIPLARARALNQVSRSGKIAYIDRRSEFNEFALAYLSDPIVDAYINSISYIRNNSLIEADSGREPEIIFYWEYYVKPLIFGTYWKNELEYFPKFASQKKIPWIENPGLKEFRHDYRSRLVYISREKLIQLLSMYGSGKSFKWIET